MTHHFNAQKLIELTEKYAAHNYKPLPVVLNRGEGVWVWDVEGNRYLDMLAAYSALNHGHRHPRIIKKAVEQLGKLTLTSRAFYSEELALASQEICEITGMDMVLLMNSGAEAVETAIKLARKWGYTVKKVPKYNAEIIVCENNFHGRTTTIVSFSTHDLYRANFGPFTPGFKVIPFGDTTALKNSITQNTVAFLVEPIQGEGGVVVPPEGYLKEVSDICKKENILLILDEIQTGLGRTGKLFCHHWDEGVKPDLVTIGKALGGGIVPISAVLGRKDIMELFVPGEHGSTFGGNPFACAIAREALKVLVEEDLPGRALELGGYFIERLKSISSKRIQEVRGKGLMIGIELTRDGDNARFYCEMLMKRGVLCKETHDYVIRLTPPLIITKEELDFGFKIIKEVLEGK